MRNHSFYELNHYTIRLLDCDTWKMFSHSDSLYELNAKSDQKNFKAMARIAYLFKRESGYSNCFFGERGADDWSQVRPFLIVPDGIAIGGFCLRKRAYSVLPKDTFVWGLQFIWIHPYERGKGHWRKAHDYLQTLFGNFDIESPYSVGMRSFIEKHRPELLEKPFEVKRLTLHPLQLGETLRNINRK